MQNGYSVKEYQCTKPKALVEQAAVDKIMIFSTVRPNPNAGAICWRPLKSG
jgi:hypothetical protein